MRTDLTHIACPVDLSEGSAHALAHAMALARSYGARLTVIHVFELFVPPQLLPAAAGPMVVPYPTRADLTLDVARFVERFKDPAVDVDIVVLEGRVARTIVSTATERAADLLVIGTHGRGGVDRLVLGSVAEKVLRTALCPVLVVPPTDRTTPARGFQRILSPVDFSEASIAGVALARSLAKESNARITVLHALDWPAGQESLIDDRDFSRHWHERLQQRLEALIRDEDRIWCDAAVRVEFGKPYRCILDVAEEEQSDLIVMGVAGRGAADIMFFGSTTNHVVRHARCPVLTVRTSHPVYDRPAAMQSSSPQLPG